MSCYHVWQLLFLAWYNLALDWTIFHPELAILLAVLTTQRRPSPKPAYVSKKSQKSPNCKGMVFKLITSKEQILANYSDVFDGIGCFPGPLYHMQVNPSVTPKQTPCWPIPLHLKKSFKKEIGKMLQAGALKPVNQVTPWINSFILVEGNDKLENLKLRICLDPTNLNKAIVHEPYHFKTLEDIAHLLAEACVITVCDCRERLLAPAAWWSFFILDHI